MVSNQLSTSYSFHSHKSNIEIIRIQDIIHSSDFTFAIGFGFDSWRIPADIFSVEVEDDEHCDFDGETERFEVDGVELPLCVSENCNCPATERVGTATSAGTSNPSSGVSVPERSFISTSSKTSSNSMIKWIGGEYHY